MGQIKRVDREFYNLINSLSSAEKERLLDQLNNKKAGIKVSAFNSSLSGFETIVRYMKDVENKSFKEISQILNREVSTLYTTYSRSSLKFTGNFNDPDFSILIPYEIFANRKNSVLETLVAFLVENENLSLKEISRQLGKHYSTIKTVYQRYREKNEIRK